jgi:hypothetical protein
MLLMTSSSIEEQIKKDASKEEIKEKFKSKEPVEKSTKGQVYDAHKRKLSVKEIFKMLSGFKTKWTKNILSVLKKLLG